MRGKFRYFTVGNTWTVSVCPSSRTEDPLWALFFLRMGFILTASGDFDDIGWKPPLIPLPVPGSLNDRNRTLPELLSLDAAAGFLDPCISSSSDFSLLNVFSSESLWDERPSHAPSGSLAEGFWSELLFSWHDPCPKTCCLNTTKGFPYPQYLLVLRWLIDSSSVMFDSSLPLNLPWLTYSFIFFSISSPSFWNFSPIAFSFAALVVFIPGFSKSSEKFFESHLTPIHHWHKPRGM